jgi:hypothetical protein
MESAMAESIELSDFLIELGERFIVIRFGGNLNSFVKREDFIRSFASWIVVLPNPTIEKLGKPFVNVDSISMGVASKPFRDADFSVVILLIIIPL